MANSYTGVGRNDPCPCGSGKKFKKCCLDAQRPEQLSSGAHQAGPRLRDAGRSALEHMDGAIDSYDPLTAPDPQAWLALDEQDRIDLVQDYHELARIRLPNAKAHAVFHVVVENQIADPETPVRHVLLRLMTEGLDRHDALHAIGSVLAGHLNDLMREIRSDADGAERTSDQDFNEDYFAELETLTAKGWLESG